MLLAEPTLETATTDFAKDISPNALVNAATQMRQSQVAQNGPVWVLNKAMDIQATGAQALLQTLPLATSGNLVLDGGVICHHFPVLS